MTSDESLELSLDLHVRTNLLEMLSLSLTESLTRREENSGGQKMSPKLLNKHFQQNLHNAYLKTAMKSLMFNL